MSNIIKSQLSNKQMKYISECINQATEVNKEAPSRHGCVLVSGGKIIGAGHNTSRTRVKHQRNIPAIHAEHASLRNRKCFIRGL